MRVFDRPTILVLRALGLGDLLTAVPALRALRRARPARQVVLATRRELAPLVEGFDFVDELWPTDESAALDMELSGEDVAVNLHGKGPQSTRRLLETGPSRLIAFFHPDIPATSGSALWKEDEHEVRRWCRLLEHHGIPTRRDDLYLDPPSTGPSHANDLVVIHPGASARARMWPTAHWIELVTALRRTGQRVAITGGSSEVPLAMEIATASGVDEFDVLAGKTTLEELAAVVGSARLLISADTGPAHLATAYRTLSVVLFGPTPPSTWGPPADGLHTTIWKGPPGDPNTDQPHPGLSSIPVERVLEEAGAFLDQSTSAAADLRSSTS